MSHLTIKNATLSAAGRRKFDRFADSAMNRVETLLKSLSDEIKEEVASIAPSEQDERSILSSPGTDWDFYKREGGFLYLREAIITEEISVKRRKNVLTARFGDTKKLNPLIQFGWYHGFAKVAEMVKEPSEFRTTQDAEASDSWRWLLEKWEFGGSFQIMPRDPDGKLTLAAHFEGSKYMIDSTAESVIKTIPAFNMYQFGGNAYRNTMRLRALRLLKEIAGGIFG